VDAVAYTMLPGLIDAHAHLFLEGGELNSDKRAAALELPAAELLTRAQDRAERLVRIGVAGVRDAGDRHSVGLALSRRAACDAASSANNLAPIPYIESPGAAINHRGRYGGFMSEPAEACASPYDCVEARISAGADRIKLIATGIVDFVYPDRAPAAQMSRDEIAAFVAAAASFGRQTFAHASGDEGIERVIVGGVDSVEHGYFVRDDQLARMADCGVAWVPTLAPVQRQIDHEATIGWSDVVVANLHRIIERHGRSLAAAHAMGVTIVAGSDAGSYGVRHGYGLLYELELMERAGMSSLAVLNAATGVGAARLGYKRKLGRIEPGFLSRFILTHHSPLDGVANLRKPRRVVFDGTVYDVAESEDETAL